MQLCLSERMQRKPCVSSEIANNKKSGADHYPTPHKPATSNSWDEYAPGTLIKQAVLLIYVRALKFTCCDYRKLDPDIMMVESAKDRLR